ncbi:MAG: transposon-transfer assisting family protein [Oscillospiraceae bacterium]
MNTANFTFDEVNLMCIYSTGTRQELISALREMRGYLEADENELCELTDSALSKLMGMSNAEFDTLELVPDFGEE